MGVLAREAAAADQAESASKHNFSSAVTWNLIGSVARVVITLVCQLTLLRLLGPVVAGHYAIFLVIVGAGTVLSEGGMMIVLTRAPQLENSVIRNAIFLILCYSGLTTLVLLACTVPFMRLFRLESSELYVPIVATLNVVPLGLTSVPLSILKRRYRSRDIQIIQLGAYLLGFALVALPLAFYYQSVLVMVAAFTVQTLATLVGGIIVSRCPIMPQRRGSSAIRNVSARAILVNIAFYLSESAAGVLTAHSVGTRAVGLYSTTINLLRLPTDVIVNTLHGPLLVSSAQDMAGEETRARFLSTLNVLATTICAVFVVVYLCGDQLVLPLLGSKWFDAGPVLSVVGLIMMARLLGGVSGAVVSGKGRLMLDLAAQIASLIFITGGFLLLRPQTVLPVMWIVFGSVAIRTLIQVSVAVRACEITLPQVMQALVGPAIVTAIALLPMRWIGPTLLPQHGSLGLITFGMACALLLAVRVAFSLWQSPYEWAGLVTVRLSSIRRQAPGATPAAVEQADTERTMMSATETV